MLRWRKAIKSDFGKSVSSGFVLFILNNVVAIFLTPYLLNYISKEDYGFYILCIDFLAWVVFLEFGTNKVLESKAAHLISLENHSALNISFNSSFYFQIITGFLIIPLYCVIVKLGVTDSNVQNLNLIIAIFSISAGLSIIRNLFSSIIFASKKVHLDNHIQILINVLNYSLILIIVPFFGVMGLAIINIFSVLLMLYRSNQRVKQLFPTLRRSSSYFNLLELKTLISQGIHFSIGSIATIILIKLDSFIIGRDFGLAEVAAFYITIKLYSLVQKAFQVIFGNFRPHISALYGRGDIAQMRMFFDVVAPITLGISAFVIGLIILLNELFVGIWVGENFFLKSDFNVLFGFYVLLDLMSVPSRIILTASLYNLKRQSSFRIYEAISRILGIVIFIDLGGISILPLTSICSCMLFCNIFYYYEVKTFFGVGFTGVSKNVLLFTILLFSVLSIFYFIGILEYFGFVLAIFGLIYLGFNLKRNFHSLQDLSFLVK